MPIDYTYKQQGRALAAFASRAACKGTDTSNFYPGRDGEVGGWNREDAEKVARAKALCGTCEVQAECLSYALRFDEVFGVWGGMTRRERNKLRRLWGL